MMLPALPSLAGRSGLPLHHGAHPRYNRHVIDLMHQVRRTSALLDDLRARDLLALVGVRGLQRRLRQALTLAGPEPVNISLTGFPTDDDIDTHVAKLVSAFDQ